MKLSELRVPREAKKKRKRVGRGEGSGHGGTSCRGHKGQKSRSGVRIPAWFEGGQMPLSRRVPKRGFHSPFRTEYQIVNVETLEKLAASGKAHDGVFNPEVLHRLGVISTTRTPVKILGNGELKVTLDVTAHAFSKSAVEKIQAAGGKVQTVRSLPKE